MSYHNYDKYQDHVPNHKKHIELSGSQVA